jgi:hypothetical protein
VTEPLKRSDPITAEALERMGFREQRCEFVITSKNEAEVVVISKGDGCWLVDVFWDDISLSEYTTLGELSDLCRCLGIQLAEVPE